MIITATTALIASGASVLAAHQVSKRNKIRQDPHVLAEIERLFPLTAKKYPEFNIHLKAYSEVKISRHSPQMISFIRAFDTISRNVALYNLNPSPYRRIVAMQALNYFWEKYINSVKYKDPFSVKVGFDEARKIQSNRLDDEFLNITCTLMDYVFHVTITNCITGQGNGVDVFVMLEYLHEYQRYVESKMEHRKDELRTRN